MSGKIKDICGLKFGRLTVNEFVEVRKSCAYWLCSCECGNEKVVRGDSLRLGYIKSCGCLRNETAAVNCEKTISHGHSRTPLYRVWSSMKSRCGNPASPAYKHYGGRGISVCDRWQKYENFFADMGYPPPGLTLERIDVNGNYEPSNCKWATWAEQNRNKRK